MHHMTDKSLDIQKYLGLLIRRRYLFTVVALLIMCCAVVVSYALVPMYEAKSIVFIEQNVITDIIKGIAITPSLEAKIKVIKESMLRREMLLDVIRELDMDINVRSDLEREILLKGLRDETIIQMDVRRDLFTISYRNTDPKLARDYVNTLVRKYIEENTSSKREESTLATRFLADQIETFKQRIDAADAAINRFKQENGLILSTNDDFLRLEIEDTQKELAELRERQSQMLATRKIMLSKGNALQGAAPKDSRLATLREEFEILQGKYSPAHPSVQKMRAEIESLEKAQETGKVAEQADIRDSQEYQLLNVQLNAIDKRIARLERGIEESKDLLRQLPIVQAKLKEFQRNKENESIIYQQLVSRYGQSEVSKQMELQDKSVTFRIIEPAIIPQEHVSPKRPMIMAMGIAGGLGLAFGVLMLLDRLDSSIRSQAELKLLKLPIIATLPLVRDPAQVRKTRLRDIGFFSTAGVFLTCILCVLALETVGMEHIAKWSMHLPLRDYMQQIERLLAG